MATSTSDLMLLGHQTLSLEAAQRESIVWSAEKEIAMLHVSLKRLKQLDEEKRQQQQRKQEATCSSRIKTVDRKLIAVDGEEQKLRLEILKAEVLHLEATVRHCTKAVRGEVYTATQDAQQRIKYFNKTLDVIYKKESAGRRDLVGNERYEFLVLRQRSHKELTDTQRADQLSRVRQVKQQQHDQERRRQEESLHQRTVCRLSVATTDPLKSVASSVRRASSTTRDLGSVRSTSGNEGQTSVVEAAVATTSNAHQAPAVEAAREPHEDSTTSDGPVERREEDDTRAPEHSVERRSESSSPNSSRRSSRSSSAASSTSDTPQRPRDDQDAPSAALPLQDRSPILSTRTSPRPSPRHDDEAPYRPTVNDAVPYRHVKAQVVVSHPREHYTQRLRDLVSQEDLKRLKISVAEGEAWDRWYRQFVYAKATEQQRQSEVALLKMGGDQTAQNRCLERGLKRVADDEAKGRAAIVAERVAGYDALVRKVNRAILKDHDEQNLRMAKLVSHTNRIARKMQKLDAERAQLNRAAKDSVVALRMDAQCDNSADEELAAIGESQPYPACPHDDGMLAAGWTEKLSEIESKRRKFVERESMLRRMVLQIYHRQKLKDCGFFDESKLREDQMKLAEALKDEEAAETLRQLRALDERIANAQIASQQRLKGAMDRERTLREEHGCRADILAAQADAFHNNVERTWKFLTRGYKSLHHETHAEERRRGELEREERKRREGLLVLCKQLRPLPPRKPVDPLPVPPPKFEDAVRVYNEFYKTNPTVRGSTVSQSARTLALPESKTTYFSTSGRKYLPPPKKQLPEDAFAVLYRDRTPPAADEWARQSGSFSGTYSGSIQSAMTSPNVTIYLGVQAPVGVTKRSVVERKPRPPPRDVAVGSVTAVRRKRNTKAGARLEPLRPTTEPPQQPYARGSQSHGAEQSTSMSSANESSSPGGVVGELATTASSDAQQGGERLAPARRSVSSASYESDMSDSRSRSRSTGSHHSSRSCSQSSQEGRGAHDDATTAPATTVDQVADRSAEARPSSGEGERSPSATPIESREDGGMANADPTDEDGDMHHEAATPTAGDEAAGDQAGDESAEPRQSSAATPSDNEEKRNGANADPAIEDSDAHHEPVASTSGADNAGVQPTEMRSSSREGDSSPAAAPSDNEEERSGANPGQDAVPVPQPLLSSALVAREEEGEPNVGTGEAEPSPVRSHATDDYGVDEFEDDDTDGA